MAIRKSWFGICSYSGKDRFYLGTVFAGGEAEAEQKLLELWQKISPHPPPSILEIHRGEVYVDYYESGVNDASP